MFTKRWAEIRASVDRWLGRNSIALLRISMGIVIFGFGMLKYFPGLSPAQGIVLAVNHRLTFGLIPDKVTLILFATVESVIGLSLITGRGLRVIIYPLAIWTIGILSPVVQMPRRLFSGPDHAPTLAASLVIATHVRRGRKPGGDVGDDEPPPDDQRSGDTRDDRAPADDATSQHTILR